MIFLLLFIINIVSNTWLAYTINFEYEVLLNMCWRLLCVDNYSCCVNSSYQNGRFLPWTKEIIFINNVKNHLTPGQQAPHRLIIINFVKKKKSGVSY